MRRLRTRRMLFAVVAAGTFAGVIAGVTAGPPELAAGAATHPGDLSASAPVTVVASGLNEPRSLVWGPHHHLLVSEAGTPDGVCDPTGLSCYGVTGTIADVTSGTPVRIVTGLVSKLDEQEVVGPDGLVYVNGNLYTLETGSPEDVPSFLPAGLKATLTTQAGALINVTGGRLSVVADPGIVDYQWTQA